jgi:hypothetical protein
MEDKNGFFYVSHIVRDELPKKGLAKLYFYTKEDDKYYWGLDNNSFSEEEIKETQKVAQIIKLPRLIEVERWKKKTLWADSEGRVYIANITNPYSDKIGPLEGIFLK